MKGDRKIEKINERSAWRGRHGVVEKREPSHVNDVSFKQILWKHAYAFCLNIVATMHKWSGW